MNDLLTSYLVISALDDLQEERRSVLHDLREDLKQISLVVEINQYLQLLQLNQTHTQSKLMVQ